MMNYTVKHNAPSVLGLTAEIIPNAAYGSQLVIREGTIVLTVQIAEIVRTINALEMQKAEVKKDGTEPAQVPVSEDMSKLVEEAAEAPTG